MGKCKLMQSDSRKFRSGFTMVELITTMAIANIIVLVVGVLLVSGQRTWNKTYNSAHNQIKDDAKAVTIAFGSMGRRANRLNYRIYNITGSTFTPAEPETSDLEEVVSGDAVEFRYWDVELDPEDSYELMDVTKTATAYALFYLDGDQLKVDYGSYPPGGVPDGGGARNTTGTTTIVLAENVSVDHGNDVGAFSHTTLNSVGQGCVRINIILTDPEDNQSTRVMTAAMMRNMWPR